MFLCKLLKFVGLNICELKKNINCSIMLFYERYVVGLIIEMKWCMLWLVEGIIERKVNISW